MNNLKAWEKMYESSDLDEALMLVDSVSVKSSDGAEIIAQVEDFEVKTIVEYNSPSYLSCSCPSKYPCKHEASLVYYLERHPEMFLKKPNFEEVFDMASMDDLKKFLLTEFEENPDMKKRFISQFAMDKNYYLNKLGDVFKRGEGRDFQNHGIHDLDLMEDELYDFILDDIHDVLTLGEYDFACDLMIMIAKLLNDEMTADYDSWYNLVDRFLENVNALSFCIYLDLQKLEELYANMDVITQCF